MMQSSCRVVAYVGLAFVLLWALWASMNCAASLAEDRPGQGDVFSAEEIARLGRVVDAQAFVLRSKDGKLRGLFSVDAKGVPSFQLFNKERHPVARVSIDEDDHPMMILQDANAKTSISMAIQGPGNALVVLEHGDPVDRHEAIIFHVAEDESGLSVTRNGLPGLNVLNVAGMGSISLKDKKGEDAAEIFLDRNSNPQLRMSNVDKKSIIHLGFSDINAPVVSVGSKKD